MYHHSKRPPIINLKVRANTLCRNFTVKGQVAKALAALIRARRKGITALEVSSWAYRLGAYVHILRHKFGLDIETLREEHPGGWHARYVLHTSVEILEVKE